jgi:ribulose-5-phosphate 4-epimerase/fuculose-1-phosphate aldolase
MTGDEMMDEGALRTDLVRLARRCVAEGLVRGTSGNLSGRTAGADRFVITPSGIGYDAMKTDDMVAIDIASGAPAGARTPSSDTPIHVTIYRGRTDVGAIVHTHSPHASAFSTLGEPIPPLLLEPSGYLGGEVRVVSASPSDPSLGERIAAALGRDRAVLLANHGVYAVGETPEKAFVAAVEVEEAARAATIARLLGRPRPVPDEDVAWMHAFIHERYGQR